MKRTLISFAIIGGILMTVNVLAKGGQLVSRANSNAQAPAQASAGNRNTTTAPQTVAQTPLAAGASSTSPIVTVTPSLTPLPASPTPRPSSKPESVSVNPHIPACPGSNAAGTVRCHAHVITDRYGSPLANATVPSGYGPTQFHAAYTSLVNAPDREVIAIVDAYDQPHILSDLNKYSSTFGIPSLPACSGAVAASAVPCFQKMNQRGSLTTFPSVNAGWALETSLDVEAAHAMCQNCSILLVEANSASYADLMAAVDQAVASGATVISNSYGSAEFSGETAYDSHFNHPGIAITVSSGDSGYGAQYPAASRYATAVGGTQLVLNTDGTYNSESAWPGAGSGCSAFEAKQPWQTDSLCAARTIADVSADADPNTGAAVYDSVRYQGKIGWYKVGGTSLAAPLVAGMYALAGKTSTATYANSLPYIAPALSLHDPMSGNNGSCGGTYLCTAGVGYDGPTGLGSPNGTGGF